MQLSEFGLGDRMLCSLPIRLIGLHTCFLIFGLPLPGENGVCLQQFFTNPPRSGFILFRTFLAFIPKSPFEAFVSLWT
jgi:hypothetical protein